MAMILACVIDISAAKLSRVNDSSFNFFGGPYFHSLSYDSTSKSILPTAMAGMT
jgi:hypothetical protein